MYKKLVLVFFVSLLLVRCGGSDDDSSNDGEVKPVVPVISFQYEGGPLSNTAALELNALEINYFRNYASHWAYWFALTTELEDYPVIRDRLVRYFDNNYPEYLGPEIIGSGN